MWELAVGTINMAAKTMRGLILPPGMHQWHMGQQGQLSPARKHHMAIRSLGDWWEEPFLV